MAARPNALVLCAPSGYGKTVLAAQIACSESFGDVLWIDGQGLFGSVDSVLEQLAAFFSEAPQDVGAAKVNDLRRYCDCELAALPDDHTLLLVIDDASWVADDSLLNDLTSLLVEAPHGSMMVLTTRSEISQMADAHGTWMLSSDDMRLDDFEVSAIWLSLTGRDLSDTQLKDLCAASDRHPALMSLIARRAALSGRDEGSLSDDTIGSLIKRLVEQLEPERRAVLHYAAVVGHGTSSMLRRCVGHDHVEESLSEIARIMPLATIDTGRGDCRFSIHAMIAESLASIEWLKSHDFEGLNRIVSCLIIEDRAARALEVALVSSDEDLLARCLAEVGARLIPTANSLVHRALAALPAAIVSSDHRLLKLSAETAWISGDLAGAVHLAQMSTRLADHMEDAGSALQCRLLTARLRASMADYCGLSAELTPLVAGWRSLAEPEDVASVVVSARLAYGFEGDVTRVEQCDAIEMEIRRTETLADSTLSRLDTSSSLVQGFLHGDWPGALERCMSASSYAGLTLSQQTSTICNLATAAYYCGRLDETARAVSLGLDLANGSASGDMAASLMTLEAYLRCLKDDSQDIRAAIDGAIDACSRDGDLLNQVCAYACSVTNLMLFRHWDYAHFVAERGARIAVSTGSPVFTWLCELLLAQTELALGECAKAKRVAERVLPLAEAAGASEHSLHARMILASTFMKADDLPAAVDCLSAVADYVLCKTPALTVASYLRSFPELLGPLAIAVGPSGIPSAVLGFLTGRHAMDGLKQASTMLSDVEFRSLKSRMPLGGALPADAVIRQADAVCRVRLFGGLEVVTPKGAVADRDWGKRKARLLFAMLVARSGTDVPRGELIEHLWPEMDEDRALNNFYVVWSAMKRAISPESVREAPCPFVEHVHGVCRVVPGRVVTDLDQFRTHLSDSRRARAQGDTASELSAILAAAEIYRGELLPGDVYDDWFGPLRERYRHDFEDAMLRAAQLMSDGGEPHEALSVLRRALSHDPWREDLYQATLRTQITAGQRSAAIDTYMSCRNRLVEDLGIDPSRETTLLYEQVLGMEQ